MAHERAHLVDGDGFKVGVRRMQPPPPLRPQTHRDTGDGCWSCCGVGAVVFLLCFFCYQKSRENTGAKNTARLCRLSCETVR